MAVWRSDDPGFVQRQYESDEMLRVRIETHRRYTEPRVDFMAWVLDRIPWTGRERVLDVGAGTGSYAAPTRARAKTYIAADLSWGMLRQQRDTTAPRLNLDAQRLPLAGRSVDVLLANHMLYHVPNRMAAVGEFARVLRADGVLLAATNSRHNMSELRELNQAVARRLGVTLPTGISTASLHFNLESGHAILAPYFSRIARYELKTALVFRRVEPVLAYLATTQERTMACLPAGVVWEDVMEVSALLLSQRIQQHGAFRVHKRSGVFVCRAPRSVNRWTDHA
jgi:SAM-dependent methyltransferase